MQLEADMLERLPATMQPTGQRLLAYGRNKAGYEFTVTSLVQGKANQLPTERQLRSIFLDNLLPLDLAGIKHNDIGAGNLLMDTEEDTAHLIDYGYAQPFDPLTEQDACFPTEVMFPSNLWSFETTGLSDYLVQVATEQPDKAKAFFKTYLKAKSEYHRQRAIQLEETLKARGLNHLPTFQERIRYEKVMAEALKNPEDVLYWEAERIQLMHNFGMAHKDMFFSKPTNAIENWTKTMAQAEKYRNLMEDASTYCRALPRTLQDYVAVQREYAAYYERTFNSWGGGTIDWINRIIQSTIPPTDAKELEMYRNYQSNPASQRTIGAIYPDAMDLVDILSD